MFKGLKKKASLLSLSSSSSQQSLNGNSSPASYDKILKQVNDFEIALQAMDYLLDDRTPEGANLLDKESKLHEESGSDQPAAIFPLALGVMEFIEATLGFEPEVMAKAHNTLSEAENASLINAKYNTKYQLATSHIYPPGTEFQVTYAESTLLNALVMLLQENNGMVESAKALFKLRKAYQTLDSVYKRIRESEPVFNRNLARLRKEASNNISTVDLPGYRTPSSNGDSSASLPQDVKLMKDLEKVFQMRKSRIEGTNLGNNVNPDTVNLFEGLTTENSSSITLSIKGRDALLNKVTAMQDSASPNPQLASRLTTTPSPPGYECNDVENGSDDDDDFSDAFENPSDLNVYGASLPNPSISATTESLLSVTSGSTADLSTRSNYENHLHVSTIDEFIHSGVQLCFGILQVVLSLIPPTIGKVLSIVGFKGDRETGLKMLWTTAITSRNIHGELALLCLLVFYDGPVQFVDTGFQLPQHSDANIKNILSIESKTSISDSELEKILQNPALYTPQLLRKARKYFPHNALWVLQEGRILAAQGELSKAIDVMQSFTDDPSTKIQMQQAEALLVFDRAMLYSFKHDYDNAARDFINLVEINSWSKGVYLFMAGCCYVSKWRMINLGLLVVDNIEEELAKYAEKAEYYLKKAPTYVPGYGINAKNKKGGIGGGNKQMPFDKFLLRKMSHIEARQKQYPNLSFIECIGTSPIHELIYFWNGYNRMNEKELNLSLKLLGYTGEPNSEYSLNNDKLNYSKFTETVDEAMIRYFLQSTTLRSLNKVSEGLSLLDNLVISKYVISNSPQFKFTKMSYSPYLYPTALYEKTMFVWLLRTSSKSKIDVDQAVKESKSWLKKAEIVADIGDYELSNRTGMRIKAAGDRLDQLLNLRS